VRSTICCGTPNRICLIGSDTLKVVFEPKAQVGYQQSGRGPVISLRPQDPRPTLPPAVCFPNRTDERRLQGFHFQSSDCTASSPSR
jgi:hypothetical protein